jgi:hypothetical protein
MTVAKKRVYLLVGVSVPHDTPARDLLPYVRDAVNCWGEGFHPDDPLFDSDKRTSAKVVKKSAAKRPMVY